MQHLYIEYLSDRDLYQSYMPFIKEGGLFIRTTQKFELGSEVTLEVSLPDSLEDSEIVGKVCWVTPMGAQNGTPAGVGIAFVEDPDNIHHQIDKSLARMLTSTEPTLTM